MDGYTPPSNPHNVKIVAALKELEKEHSTSNRALTIGKAITSVRRHQDPLLGFKDLTGVKGIGAWVAAEVMRKLHRGQGDGPGPAFAADGRIIPRNASRSPVRRPLSHLHGSEAAAEGTAAPPRAKQKLAKQAAKPRKPSVACPASFEGASWEALLLLDGRESHCESVQATLLQMNVPCQVRALPLGDMAWVACAPGQPEVMLPYIIERKTSEDLAASICDGRYSEQKRRLRMSPFTRVIYLVEGKGKTVHNGVTPEMLTSAMVTTQIEHGFAVERLANMTNSASYLARLHGNIRAQLKGACSGAGGISPVMTYSDYCQSCRRGTTPSVSLAFGMGLRQVQGMSAARAAAVVKAYPSPQVFMRALAEAGEDGYLAMLGQLEVAGTQSWHVIRHLYVQPALATLWLSAPALAFSSAWLWFSSRTAPPT
ncbi:unnamed protein product [Chrysoparadoxa australica]